MRAKVVIAPVAGLLAVLTACSGDNNAASPPPTTQPAERTTTSESTPANPGNCPVGEYEVSRITGKAGADVNGVPIVATSGGGLTLALSDAGKWTLTGNGAEVTLEAGTISVDATVDGAAEGSYAKAGNEYVFKQESASGKVTLTKPIAGTSSLPMSDVGPALAPGGKATLTCGAGGLTITSESVELQLEGGGASPGGGAPGSPTATGGAPSGGGTLTIADSAKTQTIDCAGRDIALNGSANKLTFTGSCGTLSVNGSKNEVSLEQVNEIKVNGSLNMITWSSGDPKVANNGTGNKVSKG